MWAKDNMNHWFMSSLTAMARDMEGNLLMGPKLYLFGSISNPARWWVQIKQTERGGLWWTGATETTALV